MDPITHYMLVFAPGRRLGADELQLRALTLGAILPDFDTASIILGIDALRSFHGTITHTIVVALLMAAVAGLIFFTVCRRNVFHFVAAGALSHLLADVPNTLLQWPFTTEGYMYFYPFSNTEYELARFFPDPVLVWAVATSALLMFALWLLYMYVRKGEHPWRIWVDERRWLERLRRMRRKGGSSTGK